MTFNPDLPVQTRDGRKARIICTDFCDDEKRNIIARVDLYNGGRESIAYFSDGHVGHYGDPHPCDLINIPATLWMNIYNSDDIGYFGGQIYSSKDEAERTADPDVGSKHRVACIEFTEGEGL